MWPVPLRTFQSRLLRLRPRHMFRLQYVASLVATSL